MEAHMSWQPSEDPILGDPKTCDALELVIVPRTRDLGDGFEVRRALPHGKRQMVGPFIWRLPCGSARRTSNPSPRSRVRGTMTSSSASQDLGSPSTGSLVGIQLMRP